ncbi:MBL fold metallo-hydrolase [Streptosporangium becharense]|nr:MBL fold metallo-hydrolase [Streptosporangium becharense]
MRVPGHGTASAYGAAVERLDRGVFAYVQPDGGWCLNNAGFVVGEREVLLVDTAATEGRARALRDAVAAVTPLPVGTVVNTHSHGDHTFGNHLFTPRATVIAHELARTEMVERGLALREMWPGVEWGDIRVEPPAVTFRDALTVHLGDRRVEVFHVGPAHTTNDVVVWLPAERVLFAGDLVLSGCTPFVLMGSVQGLSAAVARLRALEPEVVVCGHGSLRGPDVFDETQAYLTWLSEVARTGLAAGLPPLEAARRAELGPFAALLDAERLVANLHRAYAEECGLPAGARIPSAPVMREMVAYNGGSPLRCTA